MGYPEITDAEGIGGGSGDAERHDLSFLLRRYVQGAMSGSSRMLGGRRFDPGAFEVVRHRIAMRGLSPAFQGYRIVHISDVHYGQWVSGERLGGIVGMINDERPDLIAITGDFVSYTADCADDMIPLLRNLRPRDATLGVLGNHDHWAGAGKIRSFLRASGIIDVSNGVHTIERGAARLSVAGVDSVLLKKNRLDEVLEAMPPDAPAILLSHEPDYADTSAVTGRFGLQLSGHSHGGQVIIPGVGTPLRGRLCRRYPHGLYRVRDMVLYTTRGIGTNSFWLRVNCPPEVTVIELESRDR